MLTCTYIYRYRMRINSHRATAKTTCSGVNPQICRKHRQRTRFREAVETGPTVASADDPVSATAAVPGLCIRRGRAATEHRGATRTDILGPTLQ